MQFTKKNIVIDLGTVNFIYTEPQSGIYYCEPAVVAESFPKGDILAIGKSAKSMLGKTPENVCAKKPLKEGVVADYKTAQVIIKYIIGKICGKVRLFKPDILLSSPAGLSSIEKSALFDAAYSAGAGNVNLFPEPLAAAIGAGIPVGDTSGYMIINIGGGTAEVAVISLGGMIISETIKLGGNALDEAIISFVKNKYSLLIGEQTAEYVKCNLGVALSQAGDPPTFLEIKGRSIKTQSPAIIKIGSSDISFALEPILTNLSQLISHTLERVPPEISADLLDKGAVLSGGTALLSGLDKFLSYKLGIPVHRADEPIYCVCKGLSAVFKDRGDFEKNLISVR
jgi:rod shape-determining protein MreB